jgi:hypothetical protein
MKEGEWYFLVFLSALVLITTFFTRNIYISIGTLVVVLYLKKFSKNIKIPEAYKKFTIKSKATLKDEINKK